MAERRRVAVTGIGAVTPIGSGREGLWDGLRAQRSAVGRLTRFDPSIYRSHNAAEVNDFDATRLPRGEEARNGSTGTGTFSVACAKQAIEDAGIDLAREDRERIGAMMGSALGGIRIRRGAARRVPHAGTSRRGARARAQRVRAARRAATSPSSSARWVRTARNAMSCASGTIAIGDAFRPIRDGYADVMFAGGRGGAARAALLRRVRDHPRDVDAQRRSGGASRPFDKDRDGFVMGEGRGDAHPRGARASHRTRRAHLCGGRRLRHEQRRAPHDRPAPRRLAGGALDAAARCATPSSRRTRWSTSTRTAARRRSTTPPRRSPSRRRSATTPRSCR